MKKLKGIVIALIQSAQGIVLKGRRLPRSLKQNSLLGDQLEQAGQSRVEWRFGKAQFENYGSEYLRSQEWKSIRSHTLRYLGNKCEFCLRPADQVHHVKYPEKHDRGLESIAWLCLVCEPCHKVLHGNASSIKQGYCALCRTRKSAETLSIKYRKFEHSEQSVCSRCKAIALGLRDFANNWSPEEYAQWLAYWRSTIDVAVWSQYRKDRVQNILAESRDQNQKRTKANRAGVVANSSETIASWFHAARKMVSRRDLQSVDDPDTERQIYIHVRRQIYHALEITELEDRWSKRHDLGLDEDEASLLRAILRRRKGIDP